MCRYTLYVGPRLPLDQLITRPANSMIHQSYHNQEREEPMNGDGFGIAWWVPELSPNPATFRSISPAWSNRNLLELARVTASECILAHVRAATDPLSVAEPNCHPFTEGSIAFMHNGDVAGFTKVKRKLLESLSDTAFRAIHGTTDSEHLFAVFLDKLREQRGGDPAEAMAKALEAAFAHVLRIVREAGIEEPSYLNVGVADGKHAVVSRVTNGPPEEADSLYVHSGHRYVCDGDVARMLPPDPGQESVLVSSEKLTEGPGWQSVPVNHLVVIDAQRRAVVRPLAIEAIPMAKGESKRRMTRAIGVGPATRLLRRPDAVRGDGTPSTRKC